MSYIRRRKHLVPHSPVMAQSLLAMAAIGLPLASHAQAPEAKKVTALPEISTVASAEAPYKAEKASSPKLTEPLVDTPQTITVIKKEVLQEQGAITLMDALRNTPGITLQLGENGNTSAGDTFQMRGFSTQSSIFVDGIRDLGPVTRDVFNIEQIEVSKGPAGSDVGRGAASGYINLSSKLPSLDDAMVGTAAIDSGETKRLSADLNRKLGDGVAFRLNAVGQEGGQMGRKVIEKELFAIAPSIAFGLGTPTRLYLFSQHIRQDGRPDGGVPALGVPGYTNSNPLLASARRVNRDNFYGYASDYEKIDADMGTIKIEHEFSPKATLTNTTRYGKSSMDRILTGINVVTPSNTNPATGPLIDPDNPSTWTISRSRQSVLQDNTIFANTTNLVANFDAGGVAHTVSAGLEFMSEEQFAPARTGLGTAVPLASGTVPTLTANLLNPNPNDPLAGFNPALTGAYSLGKTRTAAVYAFDTIKLNDQWQLNAGLRYEHYNTESLAATLSNNVLTATRLEKGDNLFSWKAGALYKPTVDGSVYLSYATSQTPPGSANFSLSAAAGNVNGPAMDPSKTTNIELGTKWDLIRKKLAVTAALFRTDHRNELTQQDPVSLTWSQLGKRRVEGLELGAVGQITRDWSLIAGAAYMKATIKQGTTGNNIAGADTRWSPRVSANLWSTYNVNRALKVGAGVRYMGEQKRVVAPGAAPGNGAPSIDAYWVLDAVASYRVANNVSIQLNLYNLTDKFYLAALNNGGSRGTIGTERSAQLSAHFMF